MLKPLVKITTSVHNLLLQFILWILGLMTDSLCLFIFLYVTFYRYSIKIQCLYSIVFVRYYVDAHICYKLYTEFNQPGYSSLLMFTSHWLNTDYVSSGYESSPHLTGYTLFIA
jgi:hypothetical protein